MKTKLVWVAAAVAVLLAVATAALWLVGSPSWPYRLAVTPAHGLPADSVIDVQARPAVSQVHLGDAFAYMVEVRYDPGRVAEIDRTSIDKGLVLKPFEVRGTRERDLDLGGGVRAYRREYQLQLVNGQAGHLYELPGLTVRYKLKNSEGFSDRAVTPEPVFVAPRLPADASTLELRPPTGRVVDPSRRTLPWLLCALGVAVAGAAAADLAWRSLPQWRASRQERRRLDDGDALVQSYRALYAGVSDGAEPRQLVYRMGHVLRLVLAREAGAGWLAEPDAAQVPAEIRPAVTALLEREQGRRGAGSVAKHNAEEALGQLEMILSYYYGAGEVKAWRG
ncbi:MAG TPA: hypothetical protein PLJ35_02410 [Anaerolineae bacterium]|nr:hypothetical protein [Anaerolineae bacterium]HOQ97656.1 hypothetical protein [Anaerolineae bacterium]HPL27700.1 hypothetical protein [Anaerolineae bacterium]